MSRRSEGQLFIGRLSKNCRVKDLEDVFEPYGRMSRCEIKYGAEMAYAFVDYEDRRDADDAIRYENGRDVAGSSIIVEWAKGSPRPGGRGGGRDMRDRGGRGMDECYRCHRSGHWARDCPDDRHYGYRRPSRRSPRRSSYRSRSRSKSRDRHRSRSRSRDRRRRRRSRSRSHHKRTSESRSRSKSRSRSRSVDDADKNVNGDDRSRSGSKSPEREKSPTPS